MFAVDLGFQVTPGVSDGRMTEVTSPVLQPGMAVITGQVTGKAP